MSKFQKIIKYLAIAFAIYLVFSIISGIMYFIISFANIFSDDDYKLEEMKTLNVSTNISSLDIEVKSVNVIFKESSTFKIETDNQNISYEQKGNNLKIKEKKHSWFKKENTDLIIYLPNTFNFNNVEIENGAGKIKIDYLNTLILELDLGAGKVDIDNLTVTNNTSIDGGAGEINITNSILHNLELDIGVGKVTLNASIIGNNEINCGIGELDLNLIGNLNNYKIKIDKGIGNASINNEKVESNTYYGTGFNIIDVDGGIGSIDIDFQNEVVR